MVISRQAGLFLIPFACVTLLAWGNQALFGKVLATFQGGDQAYLHTVAADCGHHIGHKASLQVLARPADERWLVRPHRAVHQSLHLCH